MDVHKLYMAVNVWVTRWMHNIASPTRPPHVADHGSEGSTPVRRGGLHKKVAIDIDNKLWNGVFDFEAFTMWVTAKKFEYESPVNFARNEYAKLYHELETDDEKEASLYSYRAFQYVIWNRKIRSLCDLRSTCFAEARARDGDATAEESCLE
jgi:hypothetical protein